MSIHNHPQAAAAARDLVDKFDGTADKLVEAELVEQLDEGNVDEALKLDQVRREIEKVYEAEGR